MTFQTAFPDFDPATMPATPEGFYDSSWRNDACPSYACDELALQVYVDYADLSLRETQDCCRFTLIHWGDDNITEELLTTDDWNELMAFLRLLQQK